MEKGGLKDASIHLRIMIPISQVRNLHLQAQKKKGSVDKKVWFLGSKCWYLLRRKTGFHFVLNTKLFHRQKKERFSLSSFKVDIVTQGLFVAQLGSVFAGLK